MEHWIKEQLDAAAALLDGLRGDTERIGALAEICRAVVDGLSAGGQVLTAGNGGSAADAQHLAEELIGRYRAPRPPLAAICLVADGPALTCIANDYGFDDIFSRQVEALGRPGDLLIVFSTSGLSANINRALRMARSKGMRTIGLLGRTGGEALALCDLAWVVPHEDTARIQEIHGLLLHCICEAVERAYVS